MNGMEVTFGPCGGNQFDVYYFNKQKMIRQRNKSKIPAVEIVKSLDSFPKINKDDYVERSRTGGILTVIVSVIIVSLTISEFKSYMDSSVDFKFTPDVEFDAKLKVNLDITVAMPCHSVGADILDSTNQNIMMFGTLNEEDTWFEMNDDQRSHFEDIRYFNKYLQQEFHEIHKLLWKSAHSFLPTGVPKRKDTPDYAPDACRVYGSLELNKVAGNLHLSAGKSFPLPDGGHVHLPMFLAQNSFNFSHRIHHFSFGDSMVGIINPLDGDEKISSDPMMLYQYFMEIVPTDVETFLSKAKTYQYSVKENQRSINHHKGSHGNPGIYINYDFSPLKVTVTQSREPLLKFFIRLSSTVAGVFVTAGLICNILHFFMKTIISDSKSNEQTKTQVLSQPPDLINNIII